MTAIIVTGIIAGFIGLVVGMLLTATTEARAKACVEEMVRLEIVDLQFHPQTGAPIAEWLKSQLRRIEVGAAYFYNDKTGEVVKRIAA
ncbi:MAG: hypothetical protein COY40_02085 [Alphaproteobacteria bacterium CG_4_10_14_0_8_um_filter_53_9]|nr:MAG: hypothetical protein COY40_02085 [Alphaproteobacteria bacterium CG_4_10_14_0_8_um_filter_53_9]